MEAIKINPRGWTNYINTVGETEIDFPVVKASKVA
jgi:hypothetical protein